MYAILVLFDVTPKFGRCKHGAAERNTIHMDLCMTILNESLLRKQTGISDNKHTGGCSSKFMHISPGIVRKLVAFYWIIFKLNLK